MTRRPSTRAAFTLVELLVVISIIAILMGLLLPAVQKIRGIGPRTKAVAEVEQLGIAAKTFYGEYKFYPPTVFRIPATIQFSNTAHPDNPGCVIFQRMFPRWGRGIADGTATGLPGGGAILTGSASLVYFLGGPNALFPDLITPRRSGWALDQPVAPLQAAVSLKGPFFDFPENRISPTNGYLDPWGVPYAYFGSLDSGAYNPLETLSFTLNGATYTVNPYRTPTPPPPAAPTGFKWVNEKGCQIISAGENGNNPTGLPTARGFGPGNLWVPGNGTYVTGQSGGDDIANFNGGKMLGVN